MADKSCPAYRPTCCFVTGVTCEYNDKKNCSDYHNFVPKRPMTREIVESIGINRLGNPIGAIAQGLDNLTGGLNE